LAGFDEERRSKIRLAKCGKNERTAKNHAPNSVDAYLFHATARINQGDAVGAEAT